MNRTNRKIISPEIIKLVFFLAIIFKLTGYSFAQESPQPFDYNKTIWIVDVADNKGVVYGLPDYYEPDSYFIFIYRTLINYIAVLEPFPDAMSMQDLPSSHQLVFMNNVAEQRIFIGNHWISDGQKIALMSEADFTNVQQVLNNRQAVNTPENKHPIKPLLSGLRKGIEDNPEYLDRNLEDYYRHAINKSSKPEQSAASYSSASWSASSITGYKVPPLTGHHSSSTSDSEVSSNHKPIKAAAAEKFIAVYADEKQSSFLMGIAIFLVLTLAAFWFLKRK